MTPRDLSKRWIDDEEYFREQYETGKSFEKLVAEKIKAYGITDVIHEDASFRKTKAEIAEYTKNSGDLMIKGWPFEVKSRTEKFKTPEDWRYWPMFVDTVGSFDKKTNKPHGYIFISQETGALMGVMSEDQDKWSKQKKFDRKRKISENFYCVEKANVLDEKALIEKLKSLKNRKTTE